VKTTQLSYPNPQQLAEIGKAARPNEAPILNSLRLLEGAKKGTQSFTIYATAVSSFTKETTAKFGKFALSCLI
jgi:hypothetical protein